MYDYDGVAEDVLTDEERYERELLDRFLAEREQAPTERQDEREGART